jgi:exodeoxyribonuclease V beta subunit
VTAPDVSRPLDLRAVSLEGLQVIEASAGTGKTRTITGIYLRLVMERDIPVEQILVVTYTVAATEELRERIRDVLLQALAALRGSTVTDEMAAELTAAVDDREAATRRVQQALANFDLAAIHTIHGFCQRALADGAFESGLPFDRELVPDVRDLVQEVVDDFWRTRVVDAPVLFVQHLLDERITPESLAPGVALQLARPDLTVVPGETTEDLQALEAACLDAWTRLRAMWPEARAAVDELLRQPGLNKQRYPDRSVTTWLRRMDGYLRVELPGLRGFKQLTKFRADTLAECWKKNCVPRTHDVLCAVETFSRALECVGPAVRRRLRAMKIDLLHEARGELALRARRQRVQSFDDLLLELRQALDAPRGPALAARLRRRWTAALVDEFQDTDPAQYRIVQRIWGGSDLPVFLVGDPKQAIYRFRGADIFAYLAARQDAAARHDLIRNWRSEPALLTAVNAVFEGVRQPFVLDAIPFVPVEAARPSRPLVVAGDAPEPFRLWFLERDGEKNLYPKARAARRAAEATAVEIARLLRLADEGKTRLPAVDGGERALEGGDIAVLVRSHRQGRLVGAALARLGVASVQQAEDSVFTSREADELRRVLTGVAEPGRDDVVRAALGTELLGVTGEALFALREDDTGWGAELDAFQRFHQVWREHGFARMFRELVAERGVSHRLLAHEDGERRLTNLLHLGELLQDEAARHPRGLDALVQWMAARAADPRPQSEEQQLRLESDEHVVKIVTVHKSKGLQYPVVFCPFVWDGRLFAIDARRERDVVCHDPQAHNRATLEMEADAQAPLRLQACHEELAENLRLFYVALTRAIHRCTIVWGATNDAATSAPFWLLHAPDGVSDWRGLLGALQKRTDEALRVDLETLRARSGGTIRIEAPPQGPGVPYREPEDRPSPLEARPLRRPVTWPWRVSSFTALVADRTDERPDHDAAPSVGPGADGAIARSIFTFPGGTRAGSCLHAVFEHIDFADPDGEKRREIVAHELRRFGFSADWLPVVDDMLAQVLATPLDPGGRVRLAGVPRARRLDELEFTYPLADFDAHALRDLLRAGDLGAGAFAEAIEELAFARVSGFMRGFIDLVFEDGGRYWIVDYKSNWLGPSVDDYAADRLPPVMARESYWLQYLIYTMVLHRLLRLRVPGYEYDTHVGGVFYLFLRGMTPARGATCGVFHDRPSRALVEALDRWLGGAR